ncbi:MAG: GGDEF domain-containing protein [Actinobacteria bacterium]|nr:GGDEF domain-containing protein [Actinomycetota bacterium]
MRRLLEDRTVLFAALEGDGSIAWMSDSARSVLGIDPAALVGTPALALLHPDDHEVLVETMQESVRGAEDRPRVGLRVAHADGRWIPLEFGGMDQRDAQGGGHFLLWGSPNEGTSRLLAFLGALLAGADLATLLDQVVAWHDSTMPGTRSALFVRDADGSRRCRARSAEVPAALTEDAVVEPLLAAVEETLSIAERPGLDHLDPAAARAAADGAFVGVWVIPVVAPGTSVPQAVLVSWRQRPGPVLATQRRQIANTVQVVRLALEWTVTRAELVTAATTDLLTGLANRAQLDARIDADRSTLAGVLFCDLDDFKQVNDRYGHLVGDRILRESARRMAAAVRPTDLLVRLGGDEFAVWCPDLRATSDAERVAERLISVLDVPIEVDGHQHHIGCSVGVAVVSIGDAVQGDSDRLLAAADQALYRAKAAGKGRWAPAYDLTMPLPFPSDG